MYSGLHKKLYVSHGLVRSAKVSNGLVLSLIRLYTHMAPVLVFLKVLKTIHGFQGYTRMAECNSDKATVSSVVYTVYTDGHPYKPCVLCQTGLKEAKPIDMILV